MIKTIDPKYVTSVLDWATNPEMVESIDTEAIIAAHAQIGYWTAIAEGEYDKASDVRRYAEADARLAAKLSDPKMSQSLIDANATKAVVTQREAETKAKTQAQKLAYLYDTLGKAITAR